MEPTTSKKRPRDEESEEWDEYPPRYRPPPFYQDCGERTHQGICRLRCPRCDRKHIGACTAFCRKCAGVGHSWRHCQLFVPYHIWRKQRYGLRTTIQNLNITVPVIDPFPVVTLASLNAAVLSQFDEALRRLNAKAGVPMNSHVTMNNVNITTNIIASDKPARVTPNTSLLDRVQRVPTGPRSSIPNKRPAPTKPTFAQSAFARSEFSQPAFGQPVFGQTAFSQPSFIRNNSVGMTPIWPRHSGFSVDSKH